MEQQSVTDAPTTPNQVIYIIEAPKEKVNIKDAYNIKATTVLGVIHIICGLITLGADLGHMFNTPMSGGILGYLTPVFFFISGGLAIGGARSGNKCLVVATMVMAIISAIFAGILLIISAFALDFHIHYYRDGIEPLRCTLLVLLIAMGATMLVVAIASASLTCKPLCCRSNKQGAVHYQPNQVTTSILCLCLCLSHTPTTISNQVPASVLVNADQIAAVNLPDVQHLQAQPSPSVQLLSGPVEPPAYQDVGGVGSIYQKF